MKTIYVESASNRSWSTSPTAYGGKSYPVDVDDGFMGGGMSCDPFTHVWTLDPAYVPTQADHIAAAESVRDQLRQRVQVVTQGWVADLGLGDISDEDRAKLMAWRAYDKRLRDKDLSAAPDIEWEDEPGV